MSKRFGRNQKRKLQESIRQCQEAKEMTDGLNRWLSSRHEKDVSTLRRVEEVLGKNSALLEPKQQFSETPAESQRSISIASMETPSYSHAMSNDAIIDMELHSTVLYLLTLVKKHDPTADAIHMEFCYKDGKVGYAISEQAMTSIPAELLIQHVSAEMAKMLIQEFKANHI